MMWLLTPTSLLCDLNFHANISPHHFMRPLWYYIVFVPCFPFDVKVGTLDQITVFLNAVYVRCITYEYMALPSETEWLWFANLLESKATNVAHSTTPEFQQRMHELIECPIAALCRFPSHPQPLCCIHQPAQHPPMQTCRSTQTYPIQLNRPFIQDGESEDNEDLRGCTECRGWGEQRMWWGPCTGLFVTWPHNVIGPSILEYEATVALSWSCKVVAKPWKH